MHALAGRLSGMDADVKRRTMLDRSVSCHLTDLNITFRGQLRDGELREIRQVHPANRAEAQIRLAMSSDDLLALVDGSLHFGKAWATGRVRVNASVFDLLKLRSLV